ncbi:MAG: hypothetical protein JNK12_20475 [Acidimicrobiales bacterium]|nr:hypothetical protein [Acidimicrobiales bacterium]
MTRRSRNCWVAAAIVVAFVALGGPASPASAHEGGGTIAVDTAEPTDDGAIRYVVRLTWNNDGHPAAAGLTTITAVAVGADGSALTPVTLEPLDDGRFAATVEFPDPGDWTVRFTAVSPEATLERPQQVDPSPTTTLSPAPTTSASEAPAPTTTATPDGEDEDEDGDASKAGTVVFVVVLVIFVAGAVLLGIRMRRQGQSDAGRSGTAEGHEE